MATFAELHTIDGPFAEAIQARFEAHLHHVMATLRADGAPRVSGTELRIVDGVAYLGSMPGSAKAKDLLRDPRVAVHAAPIDVELTEGDAKIAGTAHLLDDEQTAAFFDAIGLPEEHRDGLGFSVNIDSAVLTRVTGDSMTLDIWTEEAGRSTVTR